ncbi:MAG: tail fiber domain-containing protein [Chloroflexi bacterium]|nr:tail fiber domain-containing protein [Chloroflexota bacterium]
MNTRLVCLLHLAGALSTATLLHAQGTAFTYQGRLNVNGASASGTYDFRYRLALDPDGNNYFGPSVLASGQAISNGLFTATLDFGAGAFNGGNYWLEIGVRTNGGGGYTTLNPLQSVTPAPYAIFSGTATTATTSGAVGPNGVNGVALQNNAVTSPKIAGGQVVKSLTAGANTLYDNVTLAAGNNVTITPSGQTVTIAASASGWSLAGNAGTTPGANFIGTSDNQPVEVRVNGQRALRLEPGGFGAPNVIGGSPINFVTSGVMGATIGGGGAANNSWTNSVTESFGTVGGGIKNIAGGVATVGGGERNTASGARSTVSGGDNNTASFQDATIGGGSANAANNTFATVGGGVNNTASGLKATVAGGSGNTASGEQATVSGGSGNQATNRWATVGGGWDNTAGHDWATVGGGLNNTASSQGATVSGGRGNIASDTYATVAGGFQNTNSGGSYATVGGGFQNTASSSDATVAGGSANTASGGGATVGGGINNKATGDLATVPGGQNNIAGGMWSFAAGSSARALHQGAFVWSDSSNPTDSTANDSVTFRASGGYRLFTGSGTSGAQLPAGATSWTTLSDRNAKKNFQPVNALTVLDKLANIPIQQWNYKWENDTDVPNIGPMAQDFKKAFYPGRDDKAISTLEFDGVELAAIQGLNQKLKEKDAEIQALQRRLERLERALSVSTENR